MLYDAPIHDNIIVDLCTTLGPSAVARVSEFLYGDNLERGLLPRVCYFGGSTEQIWIFLINVKILNNNQNQK